MWNENIKQQDSQITSFKIVIKVLTIVTKELFTTLDPSLTHILGSHN